MKMFLTKSLIRFKRKNFDILMLRGMRVLVILCQTQWIFSKHINGIGTVVLAINYIILCDSTDLNILLINNTSSYIVFCSFICL